jgi:hypothetical protein
MVLPNLRAILPPSILEQIEGLDARGSSTVGSVRRPASAALGGIAQAPRYTLGMQLRDARLCADCDEVHDAQQCPHCASERFSYLSRWVPLPEERVRSRPTTSPEAEIYRQLISPETAGNSRGFWRSGLMGVAAAGVLGWLWQSANRARENKPPSVSPGDDESAAARQSTPIATGDRADAGKRRNR